MYFVTYSGSKNLTSIIKFILFNIGSKTINKITLVFNIIPATNELTSFLDRTTCRNSICNFLVEIIKFIYSSLLNDNDNDYQL